MGVIKPTFCNICRANCGLLVEVVDDRIVKISGDPDNPQSRGGLCVKGRLAHKIRTSPNRLTKPLIKKNGRLIETNWVQAIAAIADRLKPIIADHGPESLTIYRGTSSRYLSNTFATAFGNLLGTPNVTGTWSLCVGPKLLAGQTTFGPPLFQWCDFRQAKLIVLWGTNPYATRMHRYFRVIDDIKQARQRGAKLVIIDPRAHRLAREADVHLAINPGTDVYLNLALAKLLIDNKWFDSRFVESHTIGFDGLAKSLANFDLNKAAAKTGLTIQAMEELALDLGKLKPASIDRREGVIHTANATQTNRSIAILSGLTGNVDVPGGLVFNSVAELDNSFGLTKPAMTLPFWAKRYPLAKDASALLPNVILNQQPYPIKALICLAGNPMGVFPNTRRVAEAMASLDLLVVNDLFLTETARLADVVIPSAMFLEKGDIETGPFKFGRWLRMADPVVKPLGQTKPEWTFFTDLARAMNLDGLPDFEDSQAIISRILDDSGLSHLDRSDLAKGVVLKPLSYGHRLTKGFATESGKIELYSDFLSRHGFDGVPRARDGCAISSDYPFRLVTGARVDPFYHSQHRNIPSLVKLSPEPLAEISDELAGKIDISDNDPLEISTPTGSVTMKAKVVFGMNSITVAIPHGWPGKENANMILDDLDCDPIAATPAYKAVPCNVCAAPQLRTDEYMDD